MRNTCLTLFAVLLLAWCAAPSADAQPPKLNDPLAGTSETSIKDQVDVAVTIYNNNLALVRDKRKLPMLPGEQSLTFMDVAQQIRPETVSLRSTSAPGSIRILEQNYEYDLMSPSRMMEKYVGKQVQLVNFSTEIGFQTREATLLSVNESPIYQVDGEIFLGHPGNVVLPKVPENLIAKPSLVWIVDNDKTDQEIELSYLTGGIQWTADYVVTLERSDKQMDLAGWVTLNNGSGTQYTNAQLKLVAGEVNVVRRQVLRGKAMPELAMADGGAAPPMQEESFAEYHLYTLPRRTTIKDKQSKQVSLLTAAGLATQKIYEVRTQEHFFIRRMPQVPKQPVSVFLKFRNDEKNRLGVALPAGVMRVYQEDSSGMLQFIGEDRIQHTPKDEDVRLRLGNAFDLVCERKQTDYQKLGERRVESSFEITLRNHKDTDVTIDLIETISGDWEIRDASHKFTKEDFRTAKFAVPVPKDGETVVKYTVRITY